jgi:hypothetical protein
MPLIEAGDKGMTEELDQRTYKPVHLTCRARFLSADGIPVQSGDFLNFTRIDLGHGSGRAHSKGRHNGCKCGVEFQSNHFPNWLVTLP